MPKAVSAGQSALASGLSIFSRESRSIGVHAAAQPPAPTLPLLIIHALYFDFASRLRINGETDVNTGFPISKACMKPRGERRKRWQPKIRTTRAGRGAVHQVGIIAPAVLPPAVATHAAMRDTTSVYRA